MTTLIDCSSKSSLIWVCTVCPDLSVRKLRIITGMQTWQTLKNDKKIPPYSVHYIGPLLCPCLEKSEEDEVYILKLMEQSDQYLLYLPFCLYLVRHVCTVRPLCSQVKFSNILGVQKFRMFKVDLICSVCLYYQNGHKV